MVLKLLILTTLLYTALGLKYKCSDRSALMFLRRPAYDFSTKILDRVAQNNDAHFVFSPLSTWLQLSALAEGAKGRTLKELRPYTKYLRNRCSRSKLRRLLRKHNIGLKNEYRRKSIIVVDELMGIKKRYIKDAQQFFHVQVLLKNFDYPVTSAIQVNRLIKRATKGVFRESVVADDFNKTVMLLSDNVFFRSAWKFPFNTAYTQTEPFYSNGVLGKVKMMSMTNYLNVTEMKMINAKVLEIPCFSGFSMLIFIPLKDSWIGDTFYHLKRTTLTSIFNSYRTEGEKLVNVRLPRFRIQSTVDNLAELLSDMGVRSIFDPNLSDLSHISDYKLYASLMTQDADIEVTEQGVRANALADFLINETSEKVDFIANRPFGYMIVDRKTQFILFAGTYSVPSVY